MPPNDYSPWQRRPENSKKLHLPDKTLKRGALRSAQPPRLPHADLPNPITASTLTPLFVLPDRTSEQCRGPEAPRKNKLELILNGLIIAPIIVLITRASLEGSTSLPNLLLPGGTQNPS